MDYSLIIIIITDIIAIKTQQRVNNNKITRVYLKKKNNIFFYTAFNILMLFVFTTANNWRNTYVNNFEERHK